jgi:hypothetical protein
MIVREPTGVSCTSTVGEIVNVVAATEAAEDLVSYDICMESQSQPSPAFDGAEMKFERDTGRDERDVTAHGEITSANDVFPTPSNPVSRQLRISSLTTLNRYIVLLTAVIRSHSRDILSCSVICFIALRYPHALHRPRLLAMQLSGVV